MAKNNMFAGCGDVAKFTAQQNVKGSGFKKSTIIVGVIIAVIFALISIIMAVVDDDSEVTDGDSEVVGNEIDNDSLSYISKVLLVEDGLTEDETMRALIASSLTLEGMADEKIAVETVSEEEMMAKLSEDSGALAVRVNKTEDGRYEFATFVKNGDEVNDGIAEIYMDYVIMYIESACYAMAGVTADEIICMEAPYYTQSLSVNDEPQAMAVSLTEMFVPMIFTFIMYAMILMHGQSITKSVISEKASKLMEYLLTSIKPYSLIFGKVLALSGMAVVQLVIWIVCGVAGYFVGTAVAEQINPGYTNYVSLIIEVMSNESTAFSVGAVVLAIVSMMAGFVMYCVLAALVAAAISKIEDMSSATNLFQMPVVIGWIIAYIAPLLGNDTLNKVINLVPVTSPFILPANILLGNCSMLEGALSFAIILATTFVLVIFTGKVYKGKLFNRK